jgi:Domain of unknown function (DUF4203)
MNIKGDMYDYYIIAAVVVGLIECFYGYRILRFLLGVLGFIAGAVVAGSLGYELSNGSELISIIAGIAGGLIGAFIMYTLYVVGLFAIGAALGFMIASYVFGILNKDPVTLIQVAAAALGGILAAVLRKPVLILATAYGGSYAAVTGVSYLIFKNFDPLDPNFLNSLGEDQLYRMAIIWFGLGVFGLVVQLMTLPKPEGTDHTVDEPDDAEAPEEEEVDEDEDEEEEE